MILQGISSGSPVRSVTISLPLTQERSQQCNDANY
jgi:hypothetical protein